MKILISNDVVFGGGGETLLYNMVTYLNKMNYEVTIMAYILDKNQFYTVYDPNVKCFRGSWPRKNVKKFTPSYFLNRIMCKLYNLYTLCYLSIKNYDVAIALKEDQTMKDMSKIRAKRKFAWIQCDHRNFISLMRSKFPKVTDEIKCMQKYDKVVCVSETAKKGVICTAGDPGNLCIRYNPIDYTSIRSLSLQPCDFVKDSSRPLIVAVGRLSPVKNFLMLLESIKMLNNLFKPFDLWIVGEGPEREKLEAYINENKLNNVMLIGFQQNPYPYIKQADILVSSSISESYGLSVQEALVLEIPVVAVKNEGIIESFDTRFGILVNNSSTELCDTLCRLFQNPSKLLSFKNAIKESYSLTSLYENRLEKINNLWHTTDK
ncbi:MAG: glycosyltransferase [Lachnospiraceae bacterium]|nr:glycosyltransferase [Lachnospiraceae bacterium]